VDQQPPLWVIAVVVSFLPGQSDKSIKATSLKLRGTAVRGRTLTEAGVAEGCDAPVALDARTDARDVRQKAHGEAQRH
jgi:hypothetical protein